MTIEEAKRKFFEDCISECDCCEYYDTRDLSNSSGCDLVDELFEKLVERQKGEWKSTKQGDIPITDRCTNCNYKMKWYKNKYKFCPECGADMRGDGE